MYRSAHRECLLCAHLIWIFFVSFCSSRSGRIVNWWIIANINSHWLVSIKSFVFMMQLHRSCRRSIHADSICAYDRFLFYLKKKRSKQKKKKKNGRNVVDISLRNVIFLRLYRNPITLCAQCVHFAIIQCVLPNRFDHHRRRSIDRRRERESGKTNNSACNMFTINKK